MYDVYLYKLSFEFVFLSWIKRHTIWNANVVYRTEVYRISICYIDDNVIKMSKDKISKDILNQSIYAVQRYSYVSIIWSTNTYEIECKQNKKDNVEKKNESSVYLLFKI
jgi:hypothetical protein